MVSKRLLQAIGVVLLYSLAPFAYSATISYGGSLGQLNYSMWSSQNTCTITWDVNGNYRISYTYMTYGFNTFVYVNSTMAINQPISGSIATVSGSMGPGLGYSDDCPSNTNGSTVNYSGNGYTIGISANGGTLSSGITVPAYVNPKNQMAA